MTRVTSGGQTPAGRLVVLLGLSGAGKSTVGARAARYLGAMFIDLDRWIEQRTGSSVAEIFAASGEAEFRRLEREATHALPVDRPLVVAPGAGWIMQPGLPESLGEGTVLVWLRVSPEEAARRLGGAASGRPLLEKETLQRLTEMLAQRESAYARAQIHICTDGRSLDAVVDELVVSLRSKRDP